MSLERMSCRTILSIWIFKMSSLQYVLSDLHSYIYNMQQLHFSWWSIIFLNWQYLHAELSNRHLWKSKRFYLPNMCNWMSKLLWGNY